MNSFIYEDKKLIEELLKIGQIKPLVQPNNLQLNQIAINTIKNLRQQLSQLKAEKNPTFKDIESLQNFKTWAETNRAHDINGNPLINNGQFDKRILEEFLTDLRDRFQSDPMISESLANLIKEINNVVGLKIPLYTSKQEEKSDQEAKIQKKPGPIMNAVKIPGNLTPKDEKEQTDKTNQINQKTEQQSQAQKEQEVVKNISANLNILNDNIIDTDQIAEQIKNIINFLAALKTDESIKLYAQMTRSVSPVLNAAISNFTITTNKSPNANSIAAKSTDGPLQLKDTIINTYQLSSGQQYNYQELANIATAYLYFMQAVINTIAVFNSTPEFKFAEDELKTQMQRARYYFINLQGAAQQLSSSYMSIPGPKR